MVNLLCPACVCSRANRAAFRWYELPLALLLIRPYRCTHCNTRFRRFGLARSAAGPKRD
jgi:hypothetical protein